MKYTIEFKESAKKDIKKLPKNMQPRVLKKIKQLEDNPTPAGVQKNSRFRKYLASKSR